MSADEMRAEAAALNRQAMETFARALELWREGRLDEARALAAEARSDHLEAETLYGEARARCGADARTGPAVG
jgi:hypothetical protein